MYNFTDYLSPQNEEKQNWWYYSIYSKIYILYMKMVSTLYEKIPSFYKGLAKFTNRRHLKIPINKKNIEFLCPKKPYN